MPVKLDKLAGTIGDTLKTAPTLYEDALQPAVQEVGKFVARIPRAINAAFCGIDKWILNKEYTINETKKLLAQKLENVNPEKIIEPEPYVAVPIIQAISYSMNNEELRNLYANLLANAMNLDTKDSVHPSFVEIIRQMSPNDAKIFKHISTSIFKVADIYCFKYDTKPTNKKKNKNKTPSQLIKCAGITYITELSHQEVNLVIDNLTRLNLIGETYKQNSITDKRIITSPNYINQIKKLEKVSINYYCEIEKYTRFLSTTTFGRYFSEVCISSV